MCVDMHLTALPTANAPFRIADRWITRAAVQGDRRFAGSASPSLRWSLGYTFSTWITPPEGATMANKDKGGSKSSKTAASKSLKEKRQAKKAKANRSDASSMGASTNK